LALAALACPTRLLARDTAASTAVPGYIEGPRSADGIGRRFMGREIAAVMGWQGAAWLEREEREKEERTDLLLSALQLKPGLVVADIGAGTGYLARRMAPLVAPGGKVLAVDVQPQMVQLLEAGLRKSRITNVEARLGREADVALPPASVDLAVMVDVYHELSQPFEVLASIVRALKPGGQVAFVEYRADDPRVPIKPLHTMSERQVRLEASAHPLQWVRTVSTLPWQHLIVFRRTA
jgi:SAM-dependent methyltransferase